MRLSELFPQSIDEIFSITIAASLREEVATDWDPLLFSSTDTVCFHVYKQCITIFVVKYLSVNSMFIWISEVQIEDSVFLNISIAWQYMHQYDI